MIEPETAFWEFSLEIYALPAVAEAALLLQDRDGKNVNLALYCIYAGLVLGHRFDEPILAALEAAIASWTASVIDPLRMSRRASKNFLNDPGHAGFRQRLQLLELDAEKLAQRRLVGVALNASTMAPPSLDLARANLLLYLGDIGQTLLAAVRDGLSEPG